MTEAEKDEAEQERVRALKGKGKAAAPAASDEDELDEDDPEAELEAGGSSDEDEDEADNAEPGSLDDEEDGEDGDENGATEEEEMEDLEVEPEAPAKGTSDAGPSSSKKRKTVHRNSARRPKDEDEDGSEPDIVANASGDELDQSNIIPGGRASRRTRARTGFPQRYQQPPVKAESDEDSW